MKEKLYNCIIGIFLMLRYAFIKIRKFYIKSRIKLAKHNWFISKNRNFYNPILEATVYKYGSTWSIARYGNYFGAFEFKEQAMDEAFQIWLHDSKITEIADELEDELKNLKHKILNEYKYKILDQQLNEAAQKISAPSPVIDLKHKKIMIFGKPGSGKSKFASWLSDTLDMPLHKLDEHFYKENKFESNYNKLSNIKDNLVINDAWVAECSSSRFLQLKEDATNFVIYFNFPRIICILRILKQFFKSNKLSDDRALGWAMLLRLLKNIWNFEKQAAKPISHFKEKYQYAVFKEVRNMDDLNKLRYELTGVL